MATPGEMVQLIAETLGAPYATAASVVVHDRNLISAGLRTKRGRGPSAANVTATDIARTLIAVAGSTKIKDTLKTVKRYSHLPTSLTESNAKSTAPLKWKLSRFPIPSLQELPKNYSFLDALTALIEASGDGSLTAAVKSLPAPNNPWGKVILYGPYPEASICIACGGFFERHIYSPRLGSKAVATALTVGDLRQTREFSLKTIQALGSLLNSKPNRRNRQLKSLVEWTNVTISAFSKRDAGNEEDVDVL